MKVKVEFDPTIDQRASVCAVIDAAYGVQHDEFALMHHELEASSVTPGGVTKAVAAFERYELDEPITVLPNQELVMQTDAHGSVTDVSVAPTLNGALELDTDGVPWDARIHSDAAERKTATGRWKKRRGIEQSLYESITRELQLLASGKVGTDELPIPTLADTTAAPAPIKTEDTPLVETAPGQFETVATQQPQQQAPASLPPSPEQIEQPITSYPALMDWVAKQMAIQRLTKDDVLAVCEAGNIPNLPALEHASLEWFDWAHNQLKARLK